MRERRPGGIFGLRIPIMSVLPGSSAAAVTRRLRGLWVALALAACDGSAPPPWVRVEAAARSVPVTGGSPVVARVNGAAITAADLDLAMASAARASNPHQAGGEPVAPPVKAQVLEQLIDQELAAQRARGLGLDGDPEYQAELVRMTAQLDAFRRQRLGHLLERDTGQRAVVSEADARAFFDAQAERIRTQVRIAQILLHDPAAVAQAKRELDAGATFEAVAAKTLPSAPPPGTAPWDLGYLAWNQIPEAWQPYLAQLAVGGVSPIIEGPRGRRWIIQVVDRRVDPTITFETARPQITVLLQAKAAEVAIARQAKQLRAQATIERMP